VANVEVVAVKEGALNIGLGSIRYLVPVVNTAADAVPGNT
jgi:hypothetical protein